MALSIGPNITGPILEYSTYHYNSLPYTAAADGIYYNTVQARNALYGSFIILIQYHW